MEDDDEWWTGAGMGREKDSARSARSHSAMSYTDPTPVRNDSELAARSPD